MDYRFGRITTTRGSDGRWNVTLSYITFDPTGTGQIKRWGFNLEQVTVMVATAWEKVLKREPRVELRDLEVLDEITGESMAALARQMHQPF